MPSEIEIVLKRNSRIYKEGESVTGHIVIRSKDEFSHQGVTVTVDGTVSLQLSSKTVGVFQAFYNSTKPIQILAFSSQVAGPGKLGNGVTELPFEFPVKAKQNRTLHDTYHGVYISIKYIIRVDVKRSMLSKDMANECELIVNRSVDRALAASKIPVKFEMTPDKVQSIIGHLGVCQQLLPRFSVRGQLDSSVISLDKLLTGHFEVLCSESSIKSVEIQFLRIETCGCAEGFSKDTTEIQNIQIADGDVCRGLQIPILMTFPRLFACPTLLTNNFKIEFEINFIIIFDNDHVITENFPITLFR